MNVNFDELKLQGVMSPILVMEAALGVAVHGVAANQHVVSVMIPAGNVCDLLVEQLLRMEITHNGKVMRVDRVSDGVAPNEGQPYKYREYGFSVPEAKRGPSQLDMENAKKVFAALEREAGNRFNPTSVLLENNPRALEEFVVEAPIGSGRGAGAGFVVKPRYQVGK